MKKFIVSIVFVILLIHSLLLAETYQWTDAEGSVHFSDNPLSVPKGKRPTLRQDLDSNKPALKVFRQSSTITERQKINEAPEKLNADAQPKINIAIETNNIKAVWNTLRNAIIRKDFETASRQFVPVAQAQYKAQFLSSPSETVKRFKEIKYIEVYSIDDIYAQAGAIREESDGEFSYPINFARGPNGEWKVYGM